MDLTRKLLTTSVIVVGLSPYIALSLLSLVQTRVWADWSEMLSDLYSEHPVWRIDTAMASLVGSWESLAVLGAALLVIGVLFRSRLAVAVIAVVPIAAQLPGIVANTKFQWMWLSSNSPPFSGEPNIILVGLALVTTPVALYSLWSAASFERLGRALSHGQPEPKPMLKAQLSNFLILVGVIGVALVAGAVALAPIAGLSDTITGWIVDSASLLIWVIVASSVLLMGVLYSFIHSKWSLPFVSSKTGDSS